MAALPAHAQQQKTYQFQCNGGKNFRATFGAERAIAALDDGKSLLMRQVPAASGTQYKNAGYTLSTKGNEAFITLDTRTIYQSCSTPSEGSSSQPSPNVDLNFQTAQQHVRVYRDGNQAVLSATALSSGDAWLRKIPVRAETTSAGTTYTTLQGENIVQVLQGQDGMAKSFKVGDNAPQPVVATVVSGTVSYLQRIALLPNAEVQVQLQDVGRADAPAVTIAEQTIVAQGKQVPIPFVLPYDPAKIQANGSYAIRAKILVDGQLRWTSTEAYRVITQGNPTSVDVRVNPVN